MGDAQGDLAVGGGTGSGAGAEGVSTALPPELLQLGSNLLLYLLITGLAGVVEFKDFQSQFEERRGLYTGLACQYLLLPLFGFMVVTALQMDEVVGITLLVVTSSPGGSFSNWWCSVFNADLALSVALTSVSTATSVFMLPLNLFIYTRLRYGKSVQLNWGSLGVSICVVLAAISSGLLVSARAPEYRTALFRLGNAAGITLVCLGAFFSTRPIRDADSGDSPLNYEPMFYLAVALPPVLGLVVSLAISSFTGLAKPQCVAVAIETCYQNTGIALAMALTTFTGSAQQRAASVPMFYMAVQFVMILVLSFTAWKAGWTYAAPREKLSKMLWGNHQPNFQSRTRSVTTGEKQPHNISTMEMILDSGEMLDVDNSEFKLV